MTSINSQASESLPSPNLLEPRGSAHWKIQEQIERGREFLERSIYSSKELEKARVEQSKWSKYNKELLMRLFDNSVMADEYDTVYASVVITNPSLSDMINEFQGSVNDSIVRLEAIRDRLELIPEVSNNKTHIASPSETTDIFGQEVFIVHGHDEGAKETVSRFIEKLGFKVVILHEQPNAGRTIIEKFEDYSNVSFAVILLTPDDIGAASNKPSESKPRARQNVILELGYFIAKIGRQRVCALYKDEVELPSDIHGVLYTPLDPAGAWRLSLAKDMKYAGYPIDMNKVM